MEDQKVSSHLALSTNNNCKSAIWLITINSSDRPLLLSRQEEKRKKKLALVDPLLSSCESPPDVCAGTRGKLKDNHFVMDLLQDLLLILFLLYHEDGVLLVPLHFSSVDQERVIHLPENVLEKLRSTHTWNINLSQPGFLLPTSASAIHGLRSTSRRRLLVLLLLLFPVERSQSAL